MALFRAFLVFIVIVIVINDGLFTLLKICGRRCCSRCGSYYRSTSGRRNFTSLLLFQLLLLILNNLELGPLFNNNNCIRICLFFMYVKTKKGPFEYTYLMLLLASFVQFENLLLLENLSLLLFFEHHQLFKLLLLLPLLLIGRLFSSGRR